MNPLDQAEQLARLKIAQRCQTDLYYLCKHILDYELMTEATHRELADYTYPLLPHSTPKSYPKTGGGEIKLPSDTDKKNLEPPYTHPKNFTDPKKIDILSVERHGDVPNSVSPISPSQGTDQIEAGSLTTGSPVSPKLRVSEGSTDEEPVSSLTETSETSKHQVADQFDPQKNFLLILMPRGAFKSSVVTIGFSLQTILNDPDTRILIDSETFSKSKAFLAEIKGHLESNDKFREIYFTLYGSYPDSKAKSDTWSDSQLNISARKRRRKEPTLSCSGVDATKTGMHYDLIIMDDLHSELNTANKDQIDKVKQHYKLALSLLDPGAPLIVIGTRWDYNDVYQHILDFESHRFNIITRAAHNPDGTLFFPERLTEKFLQETKESQGSYLYSCQYENNPVDEESATFKRSSFVTKEWSLVRDIPINWYLSIDPSYEGQYSDYAALVVAGMDFQRNLYVRHVTRQKMTYGEIISRMFDLYIEFKPREIALETIATQKSIQYMLNEEQKKRGMWLPIREIRSRSKSKEERIKGLAPYYEFGRIFHIKECAQRDELEYELIHFPKGTHDDVIDALATVLEIATPGGAKSERTEKLKPKLEILLKPRNARTGV